jgi:integrase
MGRRLKRAISLKRCVDSFGGPRMPSSLKQILPPGLLIRHDLRTQAFLYGPRSKLPRMSSVGRWLDVLLYTGLRRGDGRQHVRNGVATIKTEKNDTEVTLPVLPVLGETLLVGRCGDLTFIIGANGHPLDKRSFGNQFRKACREAGVRRSAHGLRKVAATRAANAGATVAELEAIFWLVR